MLILVEKYFVPSTPLIGCVLTRLNCDYGDASTSNEIEAVLLDNFVRSHTEPTEVT